jgi:hypothetical protein
MQNNTTGDPFAFESFYLLRAFVRVKRNFHLMQVIFIISIT